MPDGDSVNLGAVRFTLRLYLCLRKAHMRSIPSVRISPNVAFEKVQMFVLTDDGPVSSFGGRSSSATSFHASLLRMIDGVMSLTPCNIVSQAPQHFRSS